MSIFNNTSIDTTLLLATQTTATQTDPTTGYDHQGAALYIAVILIWYSTGLAMMLFLQVRPRSLQHQFIFESSNSSGKPNRQSATSNPFAKYRNIQADNNTKQILNELKDPERRQRLWKIYYASAEKKNEPYPQYYQTITSDTAAIDRIKRKLADIHRIDTLNDESINPVSVNLLSTETRTTSTFESGKFFAKRFPNLRRPAANNPMIVTSRPTLVRQRSQPETANSPIAVEMEPLVDSKNPIGPMPNNGSRKRSNILANRFRVEKVPTIIADASAVE